METTYLGAPRLHRLHRRHRRRLSLRFRWRGDDWLKGITGDVGTGGLWVASAEAPREGRTVCLEVKLPGGGVSEVLGQVTWAKPVPWLWGLLGRGGFGVRVERADETWYRLMGALAVGPV